MIDNKIPLVLVFYLDRELMEDKENFIRYSEYINELIASKTDNMIAIFMPTDTDSRVECVNPIMYKEADMDKFNQLLDDIKENFQVGEDATIKETPKDD